ncbi:MULTISPECIES: hypothetical protein [Protofrankia]|uniref:Uncharacterized protein n=1 Tax=Candidatus Protofrankia datiscae TaxID=2716812 RepID=F8AZP4_9ACTN|nr:MULTISPECIES: hypothetical protein [Protofrankia]AEH09647.1 hypothetical protein FsymDg_2246 [Candidatus Protofrankia datiscae]
MLAAAIVLVVILTGRSGSERGNGQPSVPVAATPTTSAPSQAVIQLRTIDDLLSRSGSARGTVVAAVQQIANCTDLSGAETDLLSAAAGRDALVDEVDSLAVSAIPDGRGMVADLRTAWVESAAADRAYAAWAREVAGICVPPAPATSSSLLAQQHSVEATVAKQQFVASWNDLARRYGLASRSADEI